MNDTRLLLKPFVVKNNDQNSILACETSFFYLCLNYSYSTRLVGSFDYNT